MQQDKIYNILIPIKINQASKEARDDKLSKDFKTVVINIINIITIPMIKKIKESMTPVMFCIEINKFLSCKQRTYRSQNNFSGKKKTVLKDYTI